MNVLRLRFRDRVEDFELKSFDELTIDEWERIARKPEKGEGKPEILERMFGIPTKYGAMIHDRQAMGLLSHYEAWISDHNRTMQMMRDVRDACEACTDRRLASIRDVWVKHRPAIKAVMVEGERYIVPQSLDTDVTYMQWSNLQVAIDRRAVAPDPDVEGDEGKPGTTTMQFYAEVLAWMLRTDGHELEWYDNGSLTEEARFDHIYKTRPGVFRKARIADAIEVCAWLMMQRSALEDEVAPGLPRQPGVAAAQVMAGQDYFTRRWGAYAQVAEPAIQFDTLRRIHGDRGMINNYPAGAVIRHMGYLAERSRFDAATQRALLEQNSRT